MWLMWLLLTSALVRLLWCGFDGFSATLVRPRYYSIFSPKLNPFVSVDGSHLLQLKDGNCSLWKVTLLVCHRSFIFIVLMGSSLPSVFPIPIPDVETVHNIKYKVLPDGPHDTLWHECDLACALWVLEGTPCCTDTPRATVEERVVWRQACFGDKWRYDPGEVTNFTRYCCHFDLKVHMEFELYCILLMCLEFIRDHGAGDYVIYERTCTMKLSTMKHLVVFVQSISHGAIDDMSQCDIGSVTPLMWGSVKPI